VNIVNEISLFCFKNITVYVYMVNKMKYYKKYKVSVKLWTSCYISIKYNNLDILRCSCGLGAKLHLYT